MTKIVATRCHILKLKCTEFDFDWGSRRSTEPPSWVWKILLLKKKKRGKREKRWGGIEERGKQKKKKKKKTKRKMNIPPSPWLKPIATGRQSWSPNRAANGLATPLAVQTLDHWLQTCSPLLIYDDSQSSVSQQIRHWTSWPHRAAAGDLVRTRDPLMTRDVALSSSSSSSSRNGNINVKKNLRSVTMSWKRKVFKTFCKCFRCCT